MARIGRNVRRYARDAVVALRVAPIEVALGIGVAVTWSFVLEAGDEDFLSWLEMAVLCGLAGGVAWAATLLHGMGRIGDRARWIMAGAGLAAVVLYDVTLLDFDRAAEGWRAALLLAALVPGITLLPLLATPPGDDPDRRFREVNLRMATRTVGVVIYSGALYLGLILAIAAVDNLFELELEGRIYGHVFGAVAFGLAPWLVVGGAPAITAPPSGPSDAGRIVRRFAAYLLLPLLLIYFGILYAYVARIAVLRELPSNLVSPLVLLAGLIGAAAVVLFAGGPPQIDSGAAQATPDNAPGQPLPWPARLAAPFFLPLGALGVWAIAVRVNQYGWTEFRYIRLAALGALLFLAGLATAALLKRWRLRAAPVAMALAAAALLAAIGPWGAVAVARRNQQGRLMDALVSAGFTDGVFPVVAVENGRPVSADAFQAVQDGGDYLLDHHGRASLAPLVTLEGRLQGDLAGRLGLMPEPDADSYRVVSARSDNGIATHRLGAGTLRMVRLPPERAGAVPGVSTVWADGMLVLRVAAPADTLTADLTSLALALLARADSIAATARPDAAPVTLGPGDALLMLRDRDGAASGRLWIRRITVERNPVEEEGGEEAAPTLRVTRLDAVLVL